jgi:hypothetical protein
MNNEPVAYVDNVWINRPDLAMDLGIGQMFSRCQLSDHQIPLYTHPVKEYFEDEPQAEELHEILQSNNHPAKELTDEEIRGVADEVFSTYKNWHHYQIDFARAIMKRCGIISGTDK